VDLILITKQDYLLVVTFIYSLIWSFGF